MGKDKLIWSIDIYEMEEKKSTWNYKSVHPPPSTPQHSEQFWKNLIFEYDKKKTSHGKLWNEVGNLKINWIEKNCKLRTNEKSWKKTEKLKSWKNQSWKIKLRFDELKKLQTIVSNENLRENYNLIKSQKMSDKPTQQTQLFNLL